MIITSVLACAMVFSPIAVQDICLNVEKVNLAEAIIIDGEWYVALITEPIYTLSERAELCEKISRMITAETLCSVQDLSSLTRDKVYASCSGRVES